MEPHRAVGATASYSSKAAKTILRSVEAHVRVVSHPENTSVSASCTSLRLRNVRDDMWSDTFTVSRVHRGVSTEEFYQSVISPCVSNCTSGQSYTFLVGGPCESGRSQTLYGTPHRSEIGVVELTARELLRMAARTVHGRGAAQPRARDATDRPPRGNGKAAEEVPHAEGGTPSEVPSSGWLTVTCSSFTTRGDSIVDTLTGKPVTMVEFAPPMGMVALPYMRQLVDPSEAIVLPKKKHVDTSCIVQFHVYASVDSTVGRRAMGTLTFVDLAAFQVPQCHDVEHLVETVLRVTRQSGDGDPQFRETKLASLLESSLVGYVTLVSLTTISGRPDLYGPTCEALWFAESIARVQQVLQITHINTPRWFMETAYQLAQLSQYREGAIQESYAAGVSLFYTTACQWLMKHLTSMDDCFDGVIEESGPAREELMAAVDKEAAALQQLIQTEEESARKELQEGNALHAATEEVLEEAGRLDEARTSAEQAAARENLSCEQNINAMRMDIVALESEAGVREREMERMKKELALYEARCSDVESIASKYAEDVAYMKDFVAWNAEDERLTLKKQRLEYDLARASQMAHQAAESSWTDRERRARLSRLTVLQRKVNTLRGLLGAPAHASQ